MVTDAWYTATRRGAAVRTRCRAGSVRSPARGSTRGLRQTSRPFRQSTPLMILSASATALRALRHHLSAYYDFLSLNWG